MFKRTGTTPARARLKIYARAEKLALDADPVLTARVTDGDYGAKDNADKDTHDENSSFPTSNAADDREFPLVREPRRRILGRAPLTLYSPFLCYNSLKTLSFHAKKLCPQTKFAAILKL